MHSSTGGSSGNRSARATAAWAQGTQLQGTENDRAAAAQSAERTQQSWWQEIEAAWEQREEAATESSGGANVKGQQQQGGGRDAAVKVTQGPLEEETQEVQPQPGGQRAAVEPRRTQARPRLDEPRIRGEVVEFGPEFLEVEREQDATQEIDMGAAIAKALEESEQVGPNQGGMLNNFNGVFVEPPTGPFDKMDDYARGKLVEAEGILKEGGQLPAGRDWRTDSLARYRNNKTFRLAISTSDLLR